MTSQKPRNEVATLHRRRHIQELRPAATALDLEFRRSADQTAAIFYWNVYPTELRNQMCGWLLQQGRGVGGVLNTPPLRVGLGGGGGGGGH